MNLLSSPSSIRAFRRLASMALSLGLSVATLAAEAESPDLQAVELSTPTGTLRGSLAIPRSAPPYPVLLILGGSGHIDRDGNNLSAGMRTDALAQLAAALAARGIASVRYDKRNVGASAVSDESTLRIDTYAADAAGWIEKLNADARFSNVSVLGHSQGALVGALAIKARAVDSLIWLEAPAVRASYALRLQLKGQLPERLERESNRILDSLDNGQQVENIPAELATFYRPSLQGHLISWFRLDPLKELAGTRARVLIIQGLSDLQVPPDNASKLRAARQDASVVMIPGMNHLLKATGDDVQKQRQSIVDPTVPLGSGLVSAIADFVLKSF